MDFGGIALAGTLKSINIPIGKHRFLEGGRISGHALDPLLNICFLGGPGSSRARVRAAPSAGMMKTVEIAVYSGAFLGWILGNHGEINLELSK